MAEPHTQNEKRSGRRLGRRIATVVVVSGIAYLIGVGFFSVIPQIFYPPTASLPDDLTCANVLGDLRGELLSRAGDHIERGGSESPGELRAWLDDWDRRHAGLDDRCDGSERERWERLDRLRRRLQGTLERFDREEGELARATNRASST